jgi:N-carbamoylputrescine amidase
MVQVISATLQPSLCATGKSDPQLLQVGLYQMKWYDDPSEHLKQLHAGVAACAHAGAQIVFLPELTLSRYPADKRPESVGDRQPEDIMTGPSMAFAKDAARENDVFVQVSLYEKVERDDELGFNTALLVAPNGEIVAQTRKLHIPVTEGYFEDYYFAEGPSDNPYPVHGVAVDSTDVKVGLPTCWDEWFPEVARNYGLRGADLLCYPTAIGSEPDHPQFNTRPLWQSVIVGHAIANGLFIAVPNRTGTEGLIRFYGGSFIADPFGRILVEAPENEEVALVAEIDLNHRQDWLQLFPFFATRRPDTYAKLTEPVTNPRQQDGNGATGPIPGISAE